MRISHGKNTFDREYNERGMGELFRVTVVSTMNRIPMHKLKDYTGEEINGLALHKYNTAGNCQIPCDLTGR